MATATGSGIGFTKSFKEHGLIIGMLCAWCDQTYQYGLNRFYSKQTRYDIFWPEFQCIGEQAVLSKEIYADASAGDEDVWGYNERYCEYKYMPSQISGYLRSQDPASLDIWHLAIDYGARPTLNNTWIDEQPPFDRITTTHASPQFIMDSYHEYNCVRPMGVRAIPGLIDHF